MSAVQTNAIPKRRGRKPKHTVETLQTQLKTPRPIDLPIFHFHFSEEMTERFTYFASLHRFDERKVFKENWQKWIAEPDVADCLLRETAKLRSEGYDGDVLGKMFKSVRYYYRKKNPSPPPPQKRKVYESVSKDILAEMDQHILRQITENYLYTESGASKASPAIITVSPSHAFANYVSHHAEFPSKTAQKEYETKYKKTYKNRFFLLTKVLRAIQPSANHTDHTPHMTAVPTPRDPPVATPPADGR